MLVSMTSGTAEGQSQGKRDWRLHCSNPNLARALYDYDPQRDDELEFKEGDIITILYKNEDDWYEGILDGRRGLFPSNYVEELSNDTDI